MIQVTRISGSAMKSRVLVHGKVICRFFGKDALLKARNYAEQSTGVTRDWRGNFVRVRREDIAIHYCAGEQQ